MKQAFLHLNMGREIAKKLKYEDYVLAECMNESDKFVQLIEERVHACTI